LNIVNVQAVNFTVELAGYQPELEFYGMTLELKKRKVAANQPSRNSNTSN